MSHVFISYNQTDADFAAVAMMTLEKAGFDTWVDKNRLRPGADWSEEIDRGILEAFAVLLVMSPDSRSSEYVTYEWSFAIGAGIRVVPVLLRSTEIHPRLLRLQYLDFRGTVRPWDDLIVELAAVRTVVCAQPPLPKDMPAFLRRALLDLDSGNSADRRGALDVLLESASEAARALLRRALTHPLRDVRGMAAVRLAQLNDSDVHADACIKALTEALELDDRTRDQAVAALGRIGKDAFRFVAEAAATRGTRWSANALRLLSALGGSAAVPILTGFLDEGSGAPPQVIESAVTQLGQLKVASAVRLILAVVTADPLCDKRAAENAATVRVRAAAARALKEIGDRSVIPELMHAARSTRRSKRVFARYALVCLLGTNSEIASVLSDTEKDASDFRLRRSSPIISQHILLTQSICREKLASNADER